MSNVKPLGFFPCAIKFWQNEDMHEQHGWHGRVQWQDRKGAEHDKTQTIHLRYIYTVHSPDSLKKGTGSCLKRSRLGKHTNTDYFSCLFHGPQCTFLYDIFDVNLKHNQNTLYFFPIFILCSVIAQVEYAKPAIRAKRPAFEAFSLFENKLKEWIIFIDDLIKASDIFVDFSNLRRQSVWDHSRTSGRFCGKGIARMHKSRT